MMISVTVRDGGGGGLEGGGDVHGRVGPSGSLCSARRASDKVVPFQKEESQWLPRTPIKVSCTPRVL